MVRAEPRRQVIAAWRFPHFLHAHNMDERDMVESTTHPMVASHGEHRTRSKHNDLIRMLHVVGLATRDMDAEGLEWLSRPRFKQIVCGLSCHRVRDENCRSHLSSRTKGHVKNSDDRQTAPD